MQVFDSDGEVVGWMEAWQDDATGTTCGVKIVEKLPVHDDVFGGAFEVRMELSPPGLFDCPHLNILSAKLHMKDELITRISGQPCLLENHVNMNFHQSNLKTRQQQTMRILYLQGVFFNWDPLKSVILQCKLF